MKFFATALLVAGLSCVPAWVFAAEKGATTKVVPLAKKTSDAAELPPEMWTKIADAVNEHGGTLEDREDLVKTYAEGLWARSRSWRLSDDVCLEAIAMLANAYSRQRDPNHKNDAGEAVLYTLSDDCGDAEDLYDAVIAAFPTTLFAAEALYQQSVILTMMRQFEDAFARIGTLVETYPGSDRIADALAQGYMIAEMGRQGVRPRKFGGRIPWLKDRKAVLRFYDTLYALAPQASIAPRVLFQKGVFASEIAPEIFEGERTQEAIDAFEQLISVHPDSPLVPDAYLRLAATYESLCPGADWDQVSTRRALNYYTDFYSLYPEHPKAEFAYNRTEALRSLIAANRLSVGDFYYVRRNNMRAALVFYNEALTHAPDSPAAAQARKRIQKIRRGERAQLTFIDWLFGRYPAPRTKDFADAPSQKALDEMGFRSAESLERADDAEEEKAPLNESRRVFTEPGGDA